MKEWPIPFIVPMVRVLLDGYKTQTRRKSNRWSKCKVGDRLWVRETHYRHQKASTPQEMVEVIYETDEETPEVLSRKKVLKKYPSIHMPYSFSRILLEITDIRMEEVQNISVEDAKAEGCVSDDPILEFSQLWDEINKGTEFDWKSNPKVWVIKFKVLSTKGWDK